MRYKINHVKKKIENMSVVQKASLAIIVATFVQKGITMISSPIFTRLMNQEQFGIVSTFLSWQSIIIILTSLNLSVGVFNNGMLEFKEDRDRFVFSLVVLSWICTAFWMIVYIIFRKPLMELLQLPEELILLLGLYCSFFPAYRFWSARQRYEYKYKLLTVVTIGTSILSILISMTVVYLMPDDRRAVGKLYGSEGVLIAVAVIFTIYIAIRAKSKLSWKYIKYAFKFNIFLVPHYLAMVVLSGSDKIMITSLASSEQTAIYSISYTSASMILLLWQAIDSSYAPWVYEKLGNNETDGIAMRVNQIIGVFATLSMICILFAPEIVSIMAPSDYYEGIYIIPSAAVGIYFISVYSLYMRMELYAKKTKLTMVGSIIAASLNILLNYIFISYFGYLAAGYTTLFCYLILSVFHYFYVRSIGMHKYYDNKFILIVSTLMVLSSILLTQIYRFTLLRYAMIIIICIVGFKKRKMILSLVKKNK